MDTTKVKAVLLAAKYKSLSKASENFSYTPSALSHSVDALENELGVKLLERSHTGVVFSEAGELLRNKLEALLAAEQDLIHSAAAISDYRHNQLRIGTYASIANHLLPELLNGFKKRFPQVDISIAVDNRIYDWLDTDRADVLIGIENNGHAWLPIAEDDFVAVVPQDLFSGRESIQFEELCPYTFITTENLAIKNHFDLQQFEEIIKVTSADDMSAVSMVQQGLGVTILPSLVLGKFVEGVRVLKLEPRLYRTLGVSYKKDTPAVSGAAKFVQYMKEITKET